MSLHIRNQLLDLRNRMDWFVGDPDYAEFTRLAEAAGLGVEIPYLLRHYWDGGIDIERARKELDDG